MSVNHVSAKGRRGALVGAFGIIAVVITAVIIATVDHDRPFGLDQPWHDLLSTHRSPVADALALFLNIAGGTVVMTIATLAIVVLLVLLRRRRAALAIALTVILSAATSAVIKAVVARPRPVDGVIPDRSDAFPSGHTTTAAAITVALLIAFPHVWSWVLACVWVPVMALSRNYLLVHWLSDVVAGVILGASVALVVASTLAMFLNKHSFWRARLEGSPQAATTTLSS